MGLTRALPKLENKIVMNVSQEPHKESDSEEEEFIRDAGEEIDPILEAEEPEESKPVLMNTDIQQQIIDGIENGEEVKDE